MKFYQSIRFRVVVTILIFGTILVVINGIITFILMGKNLDRLVNNLLETEVDYFLYQYEKDKTTPFPHSRFIKAYQGLDQVPEKVRGAVRELKPGVYTRFYKKNRPPVHVGIIKLPDTGATHYLFFHGREFFKENDFLNPLQILMISLGLLLVPGTIIGVITSRVLFRPMVDLMNKIKRLNPEKIPEQWTEQSQKGEISMLTSSIETAMQRINAFIRREKQFTRDASHELRTPLTIVKGAVEIMEQQPEIEVNPLLKKPLNRIVMSVKDMETTIETFLWLAREDNDPTETCDVEPVIKKAVENTRYLIENKDVELKLDFSGTPTLRVREEILYIAVTNLIRNAFQFTSSGSVSIISDPARITIIDTGMGIEPDRLESVTQSHIKGERSRGFGLGLSIVSRLCKRFGWELSMDSRPGKGTCVIIRWNTPKEGSRPGT
ncbi:MAG: HAMP domain-containing histidine kinase [Desulfobacterales bacterium]|nr:HAMP domain-containing histidine kinase [Desulfobacterales bacterium]